MKIKLLSILVVFVCLTLCSCSLFAAMPVKENTEIVVKEQKELTMIDENKPLLERYMPFVTVDDGCEITASSFLCGDEFEYAVYEIKSPAIQKSKYQEYHEVIYFEVVVLKNRDVFKVIRQNIDDYVVLLPDVKYIISEVDVNFDGNNDVLIANGGFGTQGAGIYTCYLNIGNDLEYCPSFPGLNTAISNVGHTLSTTNRDSAAQHSHEYYSFTEQGEFAPFEAVRFMPHSLAYSIYDNAEEFLGEDESVYDDVEYRCAAVETYNDGEWELYRIYPDEKDSPYYEHKHVCYCENYQYVDALGVELYEYKIF